MLCAKVFGATSSEDIILCVTFRHMKCVIIAFTAYIGIFNGCVNVHSIVRGYCSLLINDKRFAVEQFLRDSILLRDTVGKNSGCYTFTRNEISCIVNYLTTV